MRASAALRRHFPGALLSCCSSNLLLNSTYEKTDSWKWKPTKLSVCATAAGVRALNQKSHYRGIVSGLQSLAEAQSMPSSQVPQQAAAALQDAVRQHAPMKQVEDR